MTLLTELTLQRAVPENLEPIWTLYRTVIDDLNARQIYQWDAQYPNRNFVKESIRNRELFLLQDENADIVAAVVLNTNQASEWKQIAWVNPHPQQLAIHALIVSPHHQCRGYGRKMVQEIETYARINGFVGIRLDAFSENQPALKLYSQAGYTKRGEIVLDCKPANHQLYFCYDKVF